MSDIEWADPPPTKNGTDAKQRVIATVKKLQERPGEWALVARGMRSPGSTTTWKNRGCEAVLRRTDEGLWDIYARWPEGADQ